MRELCSLKKFLDEAFDENYKAFFSNRIAQVIRDYELN